MISLRSLGSTHQFSSVRGLAATAGIEDPSLRNQVARILIQRYYMASGGIRGPLGLPLSDVRRKDDGVDRPFAGGLVRLMHREPSPIGPGIPPTVMVRFLGFRCLEESNEASESDEPYFLISVVGTRGAVTKRFGPFEDVDAGEDFPMVSVVTSFENDIVPPIILGVIAMEHDEGTPEEAEKKAKAVAESIVNKIEEAGAAVFTGGSVGSYVMPAWFRDILVGWIPEGIAALLGLGDDEVGTNAKILFDYDPRKDKWTALPSSGTFGENPYNVDFTVGGNTDNGKYRVFFDVKVQNDGRVE